MKKDLALIKWASKLEQYLDRNALGYELSNCSAHAYIDALIHTKKLSRKQANNLKKLYSWDQDNHYFDTKIGKVIKYSYD
jgi:hypothetical protein